MKTKQETLIELREYQFKCGDGCCDNYGTDVYVNGVELELKNQDTTTIIKQVLEHLGHENVRVIETYNGKEY